MNEQHSARPTETYAIGEIAILVGLVEFSEYNGREVEIIGELTLRRFWSDRTHTAKEVGVRYRGRSDDGRTMAILPQNLRKKRPPREPLGDWELIPWKRPVKEEA